MFSDHVARAAIEEALFEVLGPRLHHYAMSPHRRSVPIFGPADAPLHQVAHTARTLTVVQEKAFAPLPHVQHPDWRARVNRSGLTRVIFRTHGDVMVAVAVTGGVRQGAAADFAREIEAAVKKRLRTVLRAPATGISVTLAAEHAT